MAGAGDRDAAGAPGRRRADPNTWTGCPLFPARAGRSVGAFAPLAVITCMTAPDGQAQQNGTDSLMTAEEVASLLQVTPAWVYAQTRRHRIPHMRLGRYVRYRRSALQVWMHDVEESSGRSHASRRR